MNSTKLTSSQYNAASVTRGAHHSTSYVSGIVLAERSRRAERRNGRWGRYTDGYQPATSIILKRKRHCTRCMSNRRKLNLMVHLKCINVWHLPSAAACSGTFLEWHRPSSEVKAKHMNGACINNEEYSDLVVSHKIVVLTSRDRWLVFRKFLIY